MPRDIEKGWRRASFRYLTKPIKLGEFMDALDLALEAAGDAGCNEAETTMNIEQDIRGASILVVDDQAANVAADPLAARSRLHAGDADA
jgi:hypothetical protein